MTFEERFLDGELIVQDKTNLEECNPEVDSMFLTTNTYYLQRKKFNWSVFFNEKVEPRRFPRPGVRDGENGIARPYDNPNNLSRDNLMGMLVYLGWLGGDIEVRTVRKIAWDILKRGSFFANTHDTRGVKKKFPVMADFAGPSVWATLLRSMKLPFGIAYLLLPFLDLYTLVATLITVKFGDPKNASTVYHNFTALHWGKTELPTPMSILAYQSYVKLKKAPEGYSNVEDVSGVVGCLRYYSRYSFDPPIFTVAGKFLNEAKTR